MQIGFLHDRLVASAFRRGTQKKKTGSKRGISNENSESKGKSKRRRE